MSAITQEIDSQPALWREAIALLPELGSRLPAEGSRVALLGCGTSFYVAQAAAVVRESMGLGETDAFVASEMPGGRTYEQVVAISRSGTTTEVVRALDALPPGVQSVAISTDGETPVVRAADDAILLPFADEQSIVQTRFATTTLALLRAHFGQSVDAAAAERALTSDLPLSPSEFEQFVFLGTGWTVGLAGEAALKFRETGGAWAESYPAMEYRHGPISVAGERTVVWIIGEAEADLADDIRATGASVLESRGDPMAELVLVHRAAVALARSRGLDPDRPRHLNRSVVLP
jgi:CRISPR-associated protein Cas5a/b/c